MDYDNKPYVLSPDSSVLDPCIYGSNIRSQVSNRSPQVYGPRQHSIIPKAEEGDDQDRKWRGRRLHTGSAISAIQEERHQRKQRQRASTSVGKNWKGLEKAQLLSPRYLQYREKARQKAKNADNQGDVWPDHLEEAFQLALRYVPPRGRKKETRGSKQCGRNELLSEKIKLWTGVERTRKQISSHIQVLKAFMNDNEEWMRHVTSNEDSASTAAKPSEAVSIVDNTNFFQSMTEAELDLYARTHYGNPGQAMYSGALVPPPTGILGSNAPGQGASVKRIEFAMFVVSPEGEKIHDYTANQVGIGGPSRDLEAVRNWRESYPPLERYYEHGQVDSQIILIDCSLDLLGKYPPKGSTLSIGFKVIIAGLTGNETWSTKAEYFEDNGQPIDMRAFYIKNKMRKNMPWDAPNVFPGLNNSEVKLEIPLQSTWWVQFFTRMAARRLETKDNPYLDQHEDEGPRRYLQEMSIMQELWMHPEDSALSAQRVAIILWKFSQTRGGEAGITTWHKLKQPPPRVKIDSPCRPPSRQSQHSMMLDTALQDLKMPQAVSANTERFLHNVNIFADDPERYVNESQSTRASVSPALTPDYTTSFPSSTSTSFPPSVSHGYLSHEESQESACYSQESGRSRNGSIDDQYSLVFNQESTYTYGEPKTYVDDLGCYQEGQELESQDAGYYTQQSFGSVEHYTPHHHFQPYDAGLDHNNAFATHDFGGGQIQLSYQKHEMSPDTQASSASETVRENPSQSHIQITHHEHQASTHDALAAESGMTATDQVHNGDFDFSTLETHFTPEEMAALHDPEHRQDGDLAELLRRHAETSRLELHTESIEPSAQMSLVPTLDLEDPASSQTEHGIVLGEIEEEQFESLAQELGFEEIHYDESQAVVGQGERMSNGDEQDYDIHELH